MTTGLVTYWGLTALIGLVLVYVWLDFAKGLPSPDRTILVVVNVVILLALIGMGFAPYIILFSMFMLNFLAKVLMFHAHERELETLEDQLANALLIISGALKAGRSLEQGFSLVERGMPAPISDEFRTVRTEQELGVPFEESLKNFMTRTPSKDYKLFLTATLFQRETGGNLIALYDQIVFAVSERRRLKGRLDNMTLQGRYTAYIMMFIPVVFCGTLLLVNQDRFRALVAQPYGTQLFFFSFAWLSIGMVLLWSIVNKKIG
jgi:tight adherence protein B